MRSSLRNHVRTRRTGDHRAGLRTASARRIVDRLQRLELPPVGPAPLPASCSCTASAGTARATTLPRPLPRRPGLLWLRADYGLASPSSPIGGTVALEKSAPEIKAFVDRVLQTTGAGQGRHRRPLRGRVPIALRAEGPRIRRQGRSRRRDGAADARDHVRRPGRGPRTSSGSAPRSTRPQDLRLPGLRRADHRRLGRPPS